MEMKFYQGVFEYLHLSFLVNDAVNRITCFFESIDNPVPSTFHP